MQNNKGCVRIDMMMWLFPKMQNFLHIATQKKSVFWKPAFKKNLFIRIYAIVLI